MLHSAPWLWTLALLGIPAVFADSVVRRHGVFIFGLLIFSVAAVCLGLNFREHYFILMLPAVAILISLATTCAIRLLAMKFPARWLQALPVFAFAIAWGLAMYHNADVYFKLTPLQSCRLFYFPNPFPEAAPIAEYLEQHTSAADTIMVLGSEPEIYFYAHRHSASGYIYLYSLLEDQICWSVMQRQMTEEVEANRPAYVVFVNVSISWRLGPSRPPQIAALGTWMDRYLSGRFDEVRVVELARPESQPAREIYIFKRKGLDIGQAIKPFN